MPLELICPQCRTTSRLEEPALGPLIACPACGQPISVPDPLPSQNDANSSESRLLESPALSDLDLQEVTPDPTWAGPKAWPPASNALELGQDRTPLLGESDRASIFASNEADLACFASAHDPPNSLTPIDGDVTPHKIAPGEVASVATPMSQLLETPPRQIAEPRSMAIEESASQPTAPVAAKPDLATRAPDVSAAEPPEPLAFLRVAGKESAAEVAGLAVSRAGMVKQTGTTAKAPMRLGVLAATYVCGMMLGFLLGWLFHSRQTRPSFAGLTGLELIRDYGVHPTETKWVSPATAVPRAQRKQIGETAYLGHLAVTALSIERRNISLVRSDPLTGIQEQTTSAEECLVLRVRLRNTSDDVEFAPLDEMFLRPHDPKQWPTYSYIECEDGSEIPMYPLAEYSEYNIEGQSFQALKPGQEMDDIIVACEGSPARVRGKMLWRLQVRGGGPRSQSYSTVVGFEFTPDQVGG